MKPTHVDFFPLVVQVKDPIWPYRDLCDFSFSVKPGEPRTLWLDLRDRILPNGKSLYIVVAGAGPDFGAASLEGAQLRLVFKPREDARPSTNSTVSPKCATITPISWRNTRIRGG